MVTKSCFSSELSSCNGADNMELCSLSTALIEPSDICMAGPYSINAMSEQKLVALKTKYDLSTRFALRRSSRIIYNHKTPKYFHKIIDRPTRIFYGAKLKDENRSSIQV